MNQREMMNHAYDSRPNHTKRFPPTERIFARFWIISSQAESPPLQPLPALEQRAVSSEEYLMSLPVEMQSRGSKLETEPKAQHDPQAQGAKLYG